MAQILSNHWRGAGGVAGSAVPLVWTVRGDCDHYNFNSYTVYVPCNIFNTNVTVCTVYAFETHC